MEEHSRASGWIAKWVEAEEEEAEEKGQGSQPIPQFCTSSLDCMFELWVHVALKRPEKCCTLGTQLCLAQLFLGLGGIAHFQNFIGM